jgi:hypothetical protein
MALGSDWGGFRVPTAWLPTPNKVALISHCGGFGVALARLGSSGLQPIVEDQAYGE